MGDQPSFALVRCEDRGNRHQGWVDLALPLEPPMTNKERVQETRREQLRTIMQFLYGEAGRSELARDLGMSHSLISQMLRGEKPVSDKFVLRLMSEMQQILYMQSLELYQAREVAIELGRSIVPTFDLPFIQSNADHAADMEKIRKEAEEAEARGLSAEEQAEHDRILAEIHGVTPRRL